MTTYTLSIPLAPDEVARLQISVPLTPAKWELLLNVLAAMKPGLVFEEEQPDIIVSGEAE